jgi:NADH-quinone oxidoreductase subunit M
MIFTLANLGLPGTSGFIGEFLTLIGAFRINSWVAFLATTGLILSSAYTLYLYRRIIFDVLDKPSLAAIRDFSWREATLFAPLVALTIFFGVYPAPVLEASAAAISTLIKGYDTALGETKTAALFRLKAE